jgi:nucleotide-binding universal stress UspA family protein
MKKVLLATDGSPCAQDAAAFLAHLPHDAEMELTVLTVLAIPQTHRSSLSREWIDECLQQEREAATETFQQVEAIFAGANVKLRHVVREGYLGETIVEEARKGNATLVVVGARGHSAVGRLLLGSTSDYVATHAPCSVLIVRPTGIGKTDRPLRIGIGYAPSDAADAALEEIRQVPWGGETDVQLVSVVSYLAATYSQVPVDTDAIKNARGEAVRIAAERLQDVAPHVHTRLVENDHIGDGLVHFAEQQDCDLLVVGETHHSTLGRLLLGSVSRFVLRHAPCSVWVCRNLTASSD